MTTVNTSITITSADGKQIDVTEYKTIKDVIEAMQKMQKEIAELKQIIEELKNGTGS